LAFVSVPEVDPHPAGHDATAVGVHPSPRIEAPRSADRRPAASATIAVARGEVAEPAAKGYVPVVQQPHVSVEIQRVLEARAGRVPRLPVIAVDLRPAVH